MMIEVIRRAASLNCKLIVLPISQVEIPTKKRKHLTSKTVNAITNDVQRDTLRSRINEHLRLFLLEKKINPRQLKDPQLVSVGRSRVNYVF